MRYDGFNWLEFVRAHSIPYVDSGPNATRGNIYIRCPFCGAADPSEHMGLSLASPAWGCWRNPQHRGRSPVRLVRQLLGCSWPEAERLCGADDVPRTDIDLNEARQRLLSQRQVRSLRPQWVDVREVCEQHRLLGIANRGVRRRFWEYLAGRGFPERDIPALCDEYSLRCCLTGRMRRRVILPFLGGRQSVWYGFTGRTVDQAERLRYLSWSPDGSVRSVLFNEGHALGGGRVLVVVEGPFDALKIDFYGRRWEYRAVAVLGVSVSDLQVTSLYRLATRYDRVLLLFDRTAVSQAMHLASRLVLCNPLVGRLGDAGVDVGDPGGLPPSQVARVLDRIIGVGTTDPYQTPTRQGNPNRKICQI